MWTSINHNDADKTLYYYLAGFVHLLSFNGLQFNIYNYLIRAAYNTSVGYQDHLGTSYHYPVLVILWSSTQLVTWYRFWKHFKSLYCIIQPVEYMHLYTISPKIQIKSTIIFSSKLSSSSRKLDIYNDIYLNIFLILDIFPTYF